MSVFDSLLADIVSRDDSGRITILASKNRSYTFTPWASARAQARFVAAVRAIKDTDYNDAESEELNPLDMVFKVAELVANDDALATKFDVAVRALHPELKDVIGEESVVDAFGASDLVGLVAPFFEKDGAFLLKLLKMLGPVSA